MSKPKSTVEFGDFQTPPSLALAICELLLQRGVKPASIIEPNCGKGSFVLACLETFKTVTRIVGTDINARHLACLASVLEAQSFSPDVEVFRGDFYETDWTRILKPLQQPLLVIGNPPWVTNAGLGVIGGSNLPVKSNFQRHAGLDAITGKSNFDISEWMLIRELEWLNGQTGTLAMLCKKAVARKVLMYAWKNSMQLCGADIYAVDAKIHFNASVESCLLVCDLSPSCTSRECRVHPKLQHTPEVGTFGLRDARLVADICAYERWKSLAGKSKGYNWRSGIKHDCAEVMEFQKEGTGYRNGLGEHTELEENFLYPLVKSSRLANGREVKPDRWMLVTQRRIGENTDHIKQVAPKTWKYLCDHANLLNRRASAIYKGRPPFSIFGVGEYVFAPWKVAISGFYKNLEFKIVGPMGGRPVVFDDTCYFLACGSEEEARTLTNFLNSRPAREFYSSLIFWDAKRPVTVEVLSQLKLDSAVGYPSDFGEMQSGRLPKSRSAECKKNRGCDVALPFTF